MRYLRHCFFLLVLGLAAVPHAAAETSAADRFSDGTRTKIIGGGPASLRFWPAIGTLRYNDPQTNTSGHVCGGVAIAPTWFLTAAHCVARNADENTLQGCYPDDQNRARCGILQVVLGQDDLSKVSKASVFDVAKIIVHEDFMRVYRNARAQGLAPYQATDRATTRSGHDIALVRLKRPWTGAVARLALEPDSDPVFPPGADLRVAGFGYIDPIEADRQMFRYKRSDAEIFFAGSSHLLSAKVPLVATSRCSARYHQLDAGAVIGAGQLCAGVESGGRDSCQGDSGGPLVAYDRTNQKYQIGLVSWGRGCAEPGWYGIYTRISAHAKWLEARAGPLVSEPTASARASDAAAGHGQLATAALAQLAGELAPAEGRISVSIPGGARVKLKHQYMFDIQSDVAGRLVVVDIDAAGHVTQIVPNAYMASASLRDMARIGRSGHLTVPAADGSWGFPAFSAEPPAGKGRLLVLVVPDHFQLQTTVASSEQMQTTKGFRPSPPSSYLMNLVAQVVQALAETRTGNGGDTLPGWGFAVLDYEIVP